jgi:hypothetical protein
MTPPCFVELVFVAGFVHYLFFGVGGNGGVLAYRLIQNKGNP